MLDANDVPSTATLENVADALTVASGHEDDFKLSVCLLHEFSKFLGTHELTVAILILEKEKMASFFVQVKVLAHSSDIIADAMARNVEHIRPFSYRLFDTVPSCNFALKVNLPTRFLQSLLDRLCFFAEV